MKKIGALILLTVMILAVFSGCSTAQFALAKLGNDAGVFGAARMLLY